MMWDDCRGCRRKNNNKSGRILTKTMRDEVGNREGLAEGDEEKVKATTG